MEDLSRDEIIGLYDIYCQLLTEKQRLYFEDYYYSDLSLAEIAENYNISRNAVFDQIKRVEKALYEYEEKLHLKKKIFKLESLEVNDDIKELISNIIWEEI
jgi:predicted DNA-binding protein YlxM (UPF0122 family)